MPVLHIQLLGDFGLTYDNTALSSLVFARPQALLAYLVLHRDAPQSRHQLAFLFWPDATETQALTNLRNLFHKLRQVLPENEQFLKVDLQTVQWRPGGPFMLDVADFMRLVQSSAQDDLEQAVKLYRGDLLPSCYDEWIVPERERLAHMLLGALEKLMLHAESAHDYSAAIGYAKQLLQRDPLREETYRDLMRLHALNDDRAAAQVAALAGSAAVFPSVDDLLQHAEVDAVIVATSHYALYECSLAAIRAGKHVLAEKPIGMDEREAAQLEDAVTHANICFMAGYSFRYIAAWQKVHELIQAGVIGDIHTVIGNISLGPLSTGWIASPETGSGPLLYIGSHLVDQILWYLGDDPVEVSAHIRYHADTRADETTTFQVQFAKGTVIQGMVSQASARFINNLDIFGRDGLISLRGGGFNYTVEVVSKVLPAYSQPTVIHFPQVPDLRILMHQPQLAEFAQAICEQRQPSCTVTDGRRVLKVLDAIVKSDRAGQPVRLC